jgi:hypothetical protein
MLTFALVFEINTTPPLVLQWHNPTSMAYSFRIFFIFRQLQKIGSRADTRGEGTHHVAGKHFHDSCVGAS